MSRFNCIHCSYNTNSSSSWNKHTLTKKHLKNIETHDTIREELVEQCNSYGFKNMDTKTNTELSKILENPDKYRFTHLVLNELNTFHEYQNIQLFCEYMKTEQGYELRLRFENILKEIDVPANVLNEFYTLLGITI